MRTLLKSMTTKTLRQLKRFRNDNRGFSIVDSVVALGVLLIVSTGTVGLFTYGLQTTGSSKYIGVATYAARLHLESIKDTDLNYISTNFPENVDIAIQNTSLPPGSTLSVSYPNGTLVDPLTVVVTASWYENGNEKSVQLSTMLTEIN